MEENTENSKEDFIMYEFMLIVGAILVAQVLIVVAGFAIVLNPRVLKWYTKKIMKNSMELAAELAEEFDKENED
jgi:hypothetical protein